MRRLLLLVSFLQISVIFLFYPEFYGIYDEDAYLSTTYSMQHGPSFFMKVNDKDFSLYPPGNSVLLLPFTIIYWKLGFLRNILLYIGSFMLFILILRKLDIDPVYSLIFLLHPTILLFSRTLMSDIPSMFFVLLGIFLLLDKKIVAAGFSLGFLVLLRYPNLIIIIGILGALLYTKEYRKTLLLLPGIALFSFVLLGYLLYAFGSLRGPFLFGVDFFSVKYFVYNFPYYFLSLNILYPGLLLAAIFFGFKNRKFSFFVIPAFISIIFYSFYYYIHGGSNIIEKLVKGQRFIVPIIPLLLIPYLNFLQNKKFAKKMFIFIIPLLFVANCGIQYKHQQLLKMRNNLSKILREETRGTDILICNNDTDKLLNPYFSEVKFIELSDVKEFNIDSLKDNYKISFIFVELKCGENYEEKSKWIEYFKSAGLVVSYQSQNPIPIIIMSESDHEITREL